MIVAERSAPSCKICCDHPASSDHILGCFGHFKRNLTSRSPYYYGCFGGRQPSEADLTYVRSFEDKKQ
ncbi:hypothetical protein TNCV_1626831 [Trichonephila clavipes]|nr:hypothetical protein TNCV_1626831 [Trichonephila clavipes]